MSEPVQVSTAQALKAALAKQQSMYLRSSMVSQLLGQGSGLITPEQLLESVKRGASEAFCAQVDVVLAQQARLRQMFHEEYTGLVQEVDELTYRLLHELGFEPRPGKHPRRQPAWACDLPCFSYGTRKATVTSVEHVFIDDAGELGALHLRVSEHDDGCTDSWSVARRDGQLGVLEHVCL